MATLGRHPLTSWGWRAAVASVTAGVIVAAARTAPTPIINDASCPHDVRITIPPDRPGGDSIVVDSMPVAGPISNIPEFHDCQRLLAGNGAEYGTKAGIWASWQLDRLLDSLAAVPPRTAVAAAQIYSWDSAYGALGIQRHFNCLYLYRDGQSHVAWRAWMVPVGTRAADCLPPRSIAELDSDGITELRVSSVAHTLGGSNIPPAARWEWSANGRYQTIGLKCGAAWCIIGNRRGLGLSRQHRADQWPQGAPVSAPTVPDWVRLRTRVIEIRGWYDEQRLAPPEANPSRASDLRAMVFPDPRLAGYQPTDFANYAWRPAAYVVMPSPPNAQARAHLEGYRSKFNFESGWNLIMLCAGEPDRCVPTLELPAGVSRPAPRTCPAVERSETGMAGERWTAAVVARSGAVRILCVTRRMYPDRAISLGVVAPGTARWRWRVDDEPVWVSCLGGCCEVEN